MGWPIDTQCRRAENFELDDNSSANEGFDASRLSNNATKLYLQHLTLRQLWMNYKSVKNTIQTRIYQQQWPS